MAMSPPSDVLLIATSRARSFVREQGEITAYRAKGVRQNDRVGEIGRYRAGAAARLQVGRMPALVVDVKQTVEIHEVDALIRCAPGIAERPAHASDSG
jgi:hypothetical protein